MPSIVSLVLHAAGSPVGDNVSVSVDLFMVLSRAVILAR